MRDMNTRFLPIGNTLFYSLNIAPQGMLIDSSTGMITWTPALSQLGENQVEVKVSDNSLFDTQSFDITVYTDNEAEEVTRIFFNQLSQDIPLVSPIDIDVEVENAFHLKSASIVLNFNAFQLKYDSVIKSDFIPDAILLESSIDNTGGSVVLDIAGLGTTTYASGNGRIMIVTFDTISTGSCNISFGSTLLRDKDNNTITHTKGGSSSINVN